MKNQIVLVGNHLGGKVFWMEKDFAGDIAKQDNCLFLFSNGENGEKTVSLKPLLHSQIHRTRPNLTV